MDEEDDATRSAVRALFADGEPRGIREVVDGTGLDESAATGALSDLVAVGELGEKAIGSGDDAVTIWYPTIAPGVDQGNGTGQTATNPGATAFELQGADGGGQSALAGSRSGSTERVEEDLERAIDELDVPGASEMMRSWRRDALRATVRYLAEHGTVRSTAIAEAVYPGQRAGYEDRDRWWSFVSEHLPKLPGVTRAGDLWEFDR